MSQTTNYSGIPVLHFRRTSGELFSTLQIISFRDTYLLVGDEEVVIAKGPELLFPTLLPVVCDVGTNRCYADAHWERWSFSWIGIEESGQFIGKLQFQVDLQFAMSTYEGKAIAR